MTSASGTLSQPQEQQDRAPSRASTLKGDERTEPTLDPLDEEKAQPLGSVEKTEKSDDANSDTTALAVDPQAQELNDDEYPKGIQLISIATALVLSVFLVALDMTIVATAIPKITDEFNGLDKVGWYSASFFMTVGSFQSSWGKIYKYFPLKTSFLISILIFEVGSALCGAAPNAEALITGRAIAGVGAAGVAAGAYTIIAYSAPPKQRPAFTGIVGAAYGFASVVGPLIGGVFTDKVSWRWCFYINLPIGAVSAAIILIFFHTPRNAVPTPAPLREKLLQMDPIGVVLVMAGTVCFILGVQYGGTKYTWGNANVVGLLVGFVTIMSVWAANEVYQGERAMVVPRIMKKRTSLVMAGVATMVAGSFFCAIYYVPIYFQSIDGTTPIISGVRNLPMIIAVTIGTILSGGLIAQTGRYQPILIFGVTIATIGAGLLYTFDIGTPTGKWIGYQILGGAGWGLAFQIPMIVVQGSAAPEDISLATGLILFFQSYAAALLVSGAQSAFVNQMIAYVMQHDSTIDKGALVLTGATEIRNAFKGAALDTVLDGYMHGIKVVFGMTIAAVGIGFIISLFTPWQKLDQEKLKNAGGAA